MIADGWRGERTVLFGGSGFVGTAILRTSVRLREQLRTRPSEPSPIAPCRNRYLLSQYLGEPALRVRRNITAAAGSEMEERDVRALVRGSAETSPRPDVVALMNDQYEAYKRIYPALRTIQGGHAVA